MRLTELTDSYDGTPDPEIRGITLDSRQVEPGWLFAALPGSKADGRRFIGDALYNGAVAILAPAGETLPADAGDVALITDERPRRRFSLIAAQFYGRQPRTVAAVTGTNGKTSTVEFVRRIWEYTGFKAASLGTLGVRGQATIRQGGAMTTPDPVALHATLADLAAAGIEHVAMEASSHGLHQHRLDGVKVTAAGFTNLSRDHLDYHDTMEDYLSAKAHLFTTVLQKNGTAVLNADTPQFGELSGLVQERGCRVLSYGMAGEDLKLVSRTPAPTGQEIEITVGGETYHLTLPLVGTFQVMNALCALGLVMAETGAADPAFVEALAHLDGVPGRLELVSGHPRGAVYVDYAHTPDALENILAALRPHTDSTLVCIVGCGGDRDPGKRPVMGRIAADMADRVIITDDNPRTEDPAAIREAMMAASPGAENIGGRRQAIETAIRDLGAGDVLVIAGKGHEQGQIIGDTVEPFDDREEARRAIAAIAPPGPDAESGTKQEANSKAKLKTGQEGTT